MRRLSVGCPTGFSRCLCTDSSGIKWLYGYQIENQGTYLTLFVLMVCLKSSIDGCQGDQSVPSSPLSSEPIALNHHQLAKMIHQTTCLCYFY